MILTSLLLRILFNKELHMNYILEILNGCVVWEPAFCSYCTDPFVGSDPERWRYTRATDAKIQVRGVIIHIRFIIDVVLIKTYYSPAKFQ